MALIGISGKINSGKDTIANIIRWLTNPRIITDSSIEIDEDSIVSYQSFEDFNREWGNSSLWTDQWKVRRFADKLKDIVCLLIRCTREQLEDREFKEKELGEEWNRYQIFNWGKPKDIWFTSREEALEYIKHPPRSNSQTSLTYVEVNLSPRKLLQLIGTELFRNQLHPNIWINSLFADYNEKFRGIDILNTETAKVHHVYRQEQSNWIITDMRFPNELQAVKDRGGISIRVNRPVQVGNEKDENIGQLKEGWQNDSAQYYINKHSHPSETALDHITDWDYIIDNNQGILELIEKVKKILTNEKII